MKEFEKINSDIDKYGFSVILIEATDYLPSFAYSIGLWKTCKHPEIIVFGLSIDILHSIVNEVGKFVLNGNIVQPNELYCDFLENGSNYFLQVDKRSLNDYVGLALDYYNFVFPVLEFIWTDKNGCFPWDENFDSNLKFKQPLLDRNYDFKFFESENLGVFTTKQWLEESKPILNVVHDSDGDWQFLTGEQTGKDIKLVALKELILKDATLNEVFDLDYGEEAHRISIEDEWERNYIESDNE